MIESENKIIYCLEKSISKLENSINFSIANSCQNDKEVYYCLGNVLFWIGVSLERLRDNNNYEESDYEKAFRGAYNAQKHSVSLVDLQKYNEGGISFPVEFPLEIPASNYCFKKLEAGVIWSNKQIKLYNKMLSNKLIILEIKKIYKMIIENFNKCK